MFINKYKCNKKLILYIFFNLFIISIFIVSKSPNSTGDARPAARRRLPDAALRRAVLLHADEQLFALVRPPARLHPGASAHLTGKPSQKEVKNN
jgi:hypothetical protein